MQKYMPWNMVERRGFVRTTWNSFHWGWESPPRPRSSSSAHGLMELPEGRGVGWPYLWCIYTCVFLKDSTVAPTFSTLLVIAINKQLEKHLCDNLNCLAIQNGSCHFRKMYMRSLNHNWWAKRALSGEVDGKLCIAVHTRMWYIYLFICGVHSWPGSAWKILRTTKKRKWLSWKTSHGGR